MRPEVTFNSKYRDFQRQVSFHTITSKPVFLSPLELFSWLTRRNCMSSLPLTPRYHVCTQFARCSSRAQHRPSKNWYFELNVYFRQIRPHHFKKCLYIFWNFWKILANLLVYIYIFDFLKVLFEPFQKLCVFSNVVIKI